MTIASPGASTLETCRIGRAAEAAVGEQQVLAERGAVAAHDRVHRDAAERLER